MKKSTKIVWGVLLTILTIIIIIVIIIAIRINISIKERREDTHVEDTSARLFAVHYFGDASDFNSNRIRTCKSNNDVYYIDNGEIKSFSTGNIIAEVDDVDSIAATDKYIFVVTDGVLERIDIETKAKDTIAEEVEYMTTFGNDIFTYDERRQLTYYKNEDIFSPQVLNDNVISGKNVYIDSNRWYTNICEIDGYTITARWDSENEYIDNAIRVIVIVSEDNVVKKMDRMAMQYMYMEDTLYRFWDSSDEPNISYTTIKYCGYNTYNNTRSMGNNDDCSGIVNAKYYILTHVTSLRASKIRELGERGMLFNYEQKDMVRDVIFVCDLKAETSEVLYETEDNTTRIIGFVNNRLYLLDVDTYEIRRLDVETGEEEIVYTITSRNEIMNFEWCDGVMFLYDEYWNVMEIYDSREQ